MRKPTFLRHQGTSTSQEDAAYSNGIEKEGSPDIEKDGDDINKLGSPDLHPASTHAPIKVDKLARELSARQVQMIAIGGTIGTGLFLGTGKSLATGGPTSMLICYTMVGVLVFFTMLALSEMAAFILVAGSFCIFAGRFVDDTLGFVLTWNYWSNDAVSTAVDQVAVQIALGYWVIGIPFWNVSLIV